MKPRLWMVVKCADGLQVPPCKDSSVNLCAQLTLSKGPTSLNRPTQQVATAALIPRPCFAAEVHNHQQEITPAHEGDNNIRADKKPMENPGNKT
jgi:hypothetical protein